MHTLILPNGQNEFIVRAMPQLAATTTVLMNKSLVVYRRERSSVWQCRFKVDGKWQRATTKETDLEKAKVKADELRVEAEIRKRSNLPVITRKFRSIAKLAIERMQHEIASGNGKASYADYIIVINKYLIPCLGNRNITNIDYAAIDELDNWRADKMGFEPTHSTMLTHNAALNRVFDEAVTRNFLTDANRPKLEAKGRVSNDRRAAFSLAEVKAMIAGFDAWAERGRNEETKETRLLMRDYVMVLLDTGARPGKELLNVKWKQIRVEKTTIDETPLNEYDEDGEQLVITKENRSVSMPVTGKTGTHTIIGLHGTVDALINIAKRNYDVKFPLHNPLVNVIKPSNDDYVFRTRNKVNHAASYPKMFARYLEAHNLLIDPITGQSRVLYSLRHTYATFALEIDKVSIYTLAAQMHTSIKMIEKHYAHLKIRNVIEELRGKESREMINAGGVIDAAYKYTDAAKEKNVKKVKSKTN